MHNCSTCKKDLPPTAFHKDRSKKSGVSGRCKACVKKYRANYYAENSEKAKAYSSQYAKENSLFCKTRNDLWVKENRERHLAARRAGFSRRYSRDVGFQINCKVRAMLRRTLKATGKPKDFVTFEKIGYTVRMLKQRLEMNFLPGMTWANFGEWEIDHRVPLSVMLERGETRPERLNCLANLKPLWRETNRSKGARYAS